MNRSEYQGKWVITKNGGVEQEQTGEDSSPASCSVVWHPITTAPTDGTDILAVGNNYGASGHHFAVVYWENGGWCNDDADGFFGYLTHWTPLPAPPNAHAQPPATGRGNELPPTNQTT